MILRYLLRIFWIITCNLLSVSSALMLRNDRLSQQAIRFFETVHDDFLIYGITQDCQLYFVEHMNYILIKSLNVDRSNTYCYPNLVKLHLRQGIKKISLMLLIKQVGNRICTLPIDMPALQTVNNGQIFSYSIFTSLPYTACSHLRDSSFILEPDLSFMDTTFSDVIYFINAKSVGSQWDVRQFRINEHGNLLAMEKFVVYHPQRGDYNGRELSNQFIVELDLKRSLLYTLNRHQRNLVSECSFDLLFRPLKLIPKWTEFDAQQHGQGWLESFAVDGQLMLFTTSLRNGMGATSELYATNLRIRNSSVRLLHLDFVTDIGVLRKETYADLTTRNILAFGDVRQLTTQYAYGAQRSTTTTTSHTNIVPPSRISTTKVTAATTTTTLSSTTTTTTAPSHRTTVVNGIDRFYSEIGKDDRSRTLETAKQLHLTTTTTARPPTPHQRISSEEAGKERILDEEDDESDEKLVGKMEETRDIIVPAASADSTEPFWKSDISKADDENRTEDAEQLQLDDHVDDDDAQAKSIDGDGKKHEPDEVVQDVFELPQQIYPEKGDVTSNTTTAGTTTHLETGQSEATSSLNTTLQSSRALTVHPNLFASFCIYLAFIFFLIFVI